MRNRYTDKLLARYQEPPLLSELPRLPFDPQALLDELRRQVFPEITSRSLVAFGELDWLAFIFRNPQNHSAPVISIHSLLNHPQTPIEVIRHVLMHELIHIIRPPREIEGKITKHPPEFWEKERELCPRAADAWKWVYHHFLHVLEPDEELDGMRVKLKRRDRRLYSEPRYSLAEAVEAWSFLDEANKKNCEGPPI